MKLNPKQRIHEACGERSRYALNSVRFRVIDAATPVLEATNGHILARCELEWESDSDQSETIAALDEAGPEGVLLDGLQFGDAFKGRANQERFLRFTSGSWVLVNGANSTTLEVHKGFFPRVDQSSVIPDRKLGRSLTLNPKLLERLIKATGAEWITLQLPEFEAGQVQRPVWVDPCAAEGDSLNSLGVIMPIFRDSLAHREEDA